MPVLLRFGENSLAVKSLKYPKH